MRFNKLNGFDLEFITTTTVASLDDMVHSAAVS